MVWSQSSMLISPLANLTYKMLFRHEIFETFCGGGGGSGAVGAQPRQQRQLLHLALEARAQLPPKLLLWVKQLSCVLSLTLALTLDLARTLLEPKLPPLRRTAHEPSPG
jgi:hypothetical protein